MQTKTIKIIVSIVILWLVWHWFSAHHQHAKDDTIAVSVAPAVIKPATVTAQTIGTIQTLHSVQVKAMINGLLLSANFKEGEYVKQNQLILTIDPAHYLVQLEQAKANLSKDKAQLNNAELILARNTNLKQKGFVAQQALDDAKATVASLQAATAADQAAVDSATVDLNYCYIKAPISGRTGNLLIQPGNLIKSNDTSPIVIINQIDPIGVVFNLPDHYLPVIRAEKAHGPVTIKINFNGHDYTGQISFIDNTINADTGTIQLKATLNNSEELLWPGTFVEVHVPISFDAKALLVPTIAIQEGAQGHFVYVIDQTQHAHLQIIKPGDQIGNETLILSGLKAGDQVVTAGVLHLTDGAKVTVVKENP